MKKPKRSPDDLSNSRNFLQYTNMAFRMIIIILAGVFGGLKLDDWLDLGKPVFTLVCTLFAVGGSMYMIIKEALRR